jgi:exonuclease III
MNELIVVSVLVILSVIGIAWPKISGVFLRSGSSRDPDKFQRRMDLINDLLDACEGCEAETKAVTAAGDVIAKHWKDDGHE